MRTLNFIEKILVIIAFICLIISVLGLVGIIQDIRVTVATLIISVTLMIIAFILRK